MKVFVGTVIHSKSPSELAVLDPGIIGVNSQGKIAFIHPYPGPYSFTEEECTRLSKNSFIMPGLIDSHIHAPQYVFTGTGYDLPLLEWLNKYTFPRESAFKDEEYAKYVYEKVVSRVLRCGTTTASYYATIHTPSTIHLTNAIKRLGQRSYVGKVNMDQNSPSYYIETTANSITKTEEFITYIQSLNSPLITPIITPRFAPSCTSTLMHALGELARKSNLPIQTHISESKAEIQWVKQLFPECESYTDVYDKHGLLNSKTIMAHCIFLSDEEIEMFVKNGVGISHCAASNFCLESGILNVRRLLEMGWVKIGLGTDCAGGYSSSILDSMRQAITASKVTHMRNPEYKPLGYKEAIYLATLGNARVLGLEDKIGSFAVGMDFDALIVDLDAGGGDGERTIDVFPHDGVDEKIEKFVYLGDDRNITSIYVAGKQVYPFSRI